MKKAIITVMTLCLAAQAGYAMKITSDAVGNMISAGKTLTFTVAEANGAVSYTVVDYFGKKAAEGTGTTITLTGLNPGWYELTCKDDAGEASTFLGVFIDRGDTPLPKDGRIGMDTIGSGAGVAKIVRLAGLPWVRERFWWNVVQGNPSPIDWKEYPDAAQIMAAEGLYVTQVFHDIPLWVTAKQPAVFGVPDLRDIYTISRALAEKFAGQWNVFETGNEPDLAWSGRGERFAAYEKAAYLGIKDGNPNATVVAASVGFGQEDFFHQIYESGLAEYSDVLNWHFYGHFDQYASSTKAYRSVLNAYHAEGRPVWVTEGGWPLSRPMTRENLKELTCVAVRNVVMAIAAGNDKYFWFCLTDHFERGVQFNMLQGDVTPYPQFFAYSAAANIIGVSDYLGKYDSDVRCYAFSTPRGTVLVAWSDSPATLTVPTECSSIQVADTFGVEREVKPENGQVQIPIGPEAVFLIGVGDAVKAKLSGEPHPQGVITVKNPSHVVIAAYTELSVDGERGIYCFTEAQDIKPFTYSVEVYNFDTKKRTGSIVLQLPEGWSAEKTQAEVTVDPMGREVIPFTITPAACTGLANLNVKLGVEGRFDEEATSPCVSYFGCNASMLPIVERKATEWTKDVAAWKIESGDNGNTNSVNVPMKITAGPNNRVQLVNDEMKIESGSEDKFSFAILQFNPPINLSEYDGIAFTVKGLEKDDYVNLMIVESSGAQYYLSATCPKGVDKKIVMPFKEMRWAMWFTSDPNGKLDLDEIKAIRVGRSGDALSCELGDFELVKFQK